MSPCVGICLVTDDQLGCRGCHRTLEEIQRWSTMTDDERQLVMERVVLEMFEEKHP